MAARQMVEGPPPCPGKRAWKAPSAPTDSRRPHPDLSARYKIISTASTDFPYRSEGGMREVWEVMGGIRER